MISGYEIFNSKQIQVSHPTPGLYKPEVEKGAGKICFIWVMTLPKIMLPINILSGINDLGTGPPALRTAPIRCAHKFRPWAK